MLPPWLSISFLQIARPIPMPWALVVKKGVKSFSTFSLDMPIPVSLKLTSMKFLVSLVETVRKPPLSSIACSPLAARFRKTRLIMSLSTSISGRNPSSLISSTFFGVLTCDRTSSSMALTSFFSSVGFLVLEKSCKSLIILSA